jgi:hypothetical protein
VRAVAVFMVSVVLLVVAMSILGGAMRAEFDQGVAVGRAEGIAEADSATVPILRASLKMNRELIEEVCRLRGLPAPEWDDDGWDRAGGGR